MAEEKLPNWLKNRAHLSPDRPAIEFEGHTYSFLELYTLSEKMAGRLSSIGLGAGDSCAVLLRNHIDGVVVIHAPYSNPSRPVPGAMLSTCKIRYSVFLTVH